MAKRSDQVLSLARRILAAESDLEGLRRQLDDLVEENPSRPSVSLVSRTGERRATPRDGDVQTAVFEAMQANPAREYRAADFRELLAARSPARGSIESALQRLQQRHVIDRRGRGVYVIAQPGDGRGVGSTK